jgi:exopolysaccharide production protein ExoZ
MKFVQIQLLRFVAAISVVLFHALFMSERYYDRSANWRLDIFRHGDLGVDLFFVISGFIIYYSVMAANQSSLKFLHRRLIRIVPPYWFFTIVFIGAYLLFPAQFKNSSAFSLSHIAASFGYSSFLFEGGPVLYIGWSLEYEVLFYLAVFIMLLWKKERVWNVLIIVFCGSVAVGLLIPARYDEHAIRFLTNSYLLEFVFGLVVARRIFDRSSSVGPDFIVLVTALLVIYLEPTARNRILIGGIGSMTLVAIAGWMGKRNKTPGPFSIYLSKIGDASYSIYLTQVLTLSIACKTMHSLLPDAPLEIVIAVATTFTLGVGVASYLTMERPMLRIFRYGSPRRPSISRDASPAN